MILSNYNNNKTRVWLWNGSKPIKGSNTKSYSKTKFYRYYWSITNSRGGARSLSTAGSKAGSWINSWSGTKAGTRSGIWTRFRDSFRRPNIKRPNFAF